jgi:hypothetical protein
MRRNHYLSIAGAIICCFFVTGCATPPPNCVERACATADVSMQDTCVLIACGYYDPDPLEQPGIANAECMRWSNGRWEFCYLDDVDGKEVRSKGTAIYGFDVRRYYMYHEFAKAKEEWMSEDVSRFDPEG